MADSSQPKSQSLSIPADVAQKFGALVELIKGSESMNNEERQYWVNILPIMTPEQLKNLEEILLNEKKQLAAIDAKYRSSSAAANASTADGASLQDMEKRIKNRKMERQKKEEEAQQHEEQSEDKILSQIQDL